MPFVLQIASAMLSDILSYKGVEPWMPVKKKVTVPEVTIWHACFNSFAMMISWKGANPKGIITVSKDLNLPSKLIAEYRSQTDIP